MAEYMEMNWFDDLAVKLNMMIDELIAASLCIDQCSRILIFTDKFQKSGRVIENINAELDEKHVDKHSQLMFTDLYVESHQTVTI
jgi:hypothetical protein